MRFTTTGSFRTAAGVNNTSSLLLRRWTRLNDLYDHVIDMWTWVNNLWLWVNHTAAWSDTSLLKQAEQICLLHTSPKMSFTGNVSMFKVCLTDTCNVFKKSLIHFNLWTSANKCRKVPKTTIWKIFQYAHPSHQYASFMWFGGMGESKILNTNPHHDHIILRSWWKKKSGARMGPLSPKKRGFISFLSIWLYVCL